MANAGLGFPNRIYEATLTLGSWQASLPLNNLKDPILGHPARTTDAQLASTKFQIDHGKSRKCRLLSLIGTNLSVSAKIRRRVNSTTDFTTPLYDTGWIDFWPRVYSTAELDWEDENWFDGRPTTEQRDMLPKTKPLLLPSIVFARYELVEIDDTTNPDGWIEIDLAHASEFWQGKYNISYGLRRGVRTKTRVDEARSGTEYFDRRDPIRSHIISFEHMSRDESFQRAFDLMWRQGIDRDVFFIEDPDDTKNLLRNAYLARLEELNPIEHPQYSRNAVTFMLKERT